MEIATMMQTNRPHPVEQIELQPLELPEPELFKGVVNPMGPPPVPSEGTADLILDNCPALYLVD